MNNGVKRHSGAVDRGRVCAHRNGHFGVSLLAGALVFGCAQSAYDPTPWEGDSAFDGTEFPAEPSDGGPDSDAARNVPSTETADGEPATSDADDASPADSDASDSEAAISEADGGTTRTVDEGPGAGDAGTAHVDSGAAAPPADASAPSVLTDAAAGESPRDGGVRQGASDAGVAPADAGSTSPRDAGTGSVPQNTAKTCSANSDCSSAKCGLSAPFACCAIGRCGCSWLRYTYCEI
jgi:hypothetical protein